MKFDGVERGPRDFFRLLFLPRGEARELFRRRRADLFFERGDLRAEPLLFLALLPSIFAAVMRTVAAALGRPGWALGVTAINLPDGARAAAKMSPLAAGVRIQQATGVEVVLHVCCRDRNLLGLQAELLGAVQDCRRKPFQLTLVGRLDAALETASWHPDARAAST